MNGRETGKTQDFVLAQGFQEVGGYMALVRRDGGQRLMAELFADPDRPEVRPQEAYRELLASLPPGWTIRLLQVTWPDAGPRQAFLEGLQVWKASGETNEEGLERLRQGLRLSLEELPLPYHRRALLEFALPPAGEALDWWGGVTEMLARYGLHLVPLGPDEIQALAGRLLNPELG